MAVTHPANKLRNIRRRVDRARNFPMNTCGASRHVHTMALALTQPGGYPMLTEEPEHCAVSLLSVLESLWKARTELARLKGQPTELTPEVAVLLTKQLTKGKP